jgi:hypothetical protein
MSEEPENKPRNIQDEIAELVRKELIHVSELQDVEERLKAISERASRITPAAEGEEPPGGTK